MKKKPRITYGDKRLSFCQIQDMATLTFGCSSYIIIDSECMSWKVRLSSTQYDWLSAVSSADCLIAVLSPNFSTPWILLAEEKMEKVDVRKLKFVTQSGRRNE